MGYQFINGFATCMSKMPATVRDISDEELRKWGVQFFDAMELPPDSRFVQMYERMDPVDRRTFSQFMNTSFASVGFLRGSSNLARKQVEACAKLAEGAANSGHTDEHTT